MSLVSMGCRLETCLVGTKDRQQPHCTPDIKGSYVLHQALYVDFTQRYMALIRSFTLNYNNMPAHLHIITLLPSQIHLKLAPITSESLRRADSFWFELCAFHIGTHEEDAFTDTKAQGNKHYQILKWHIDRRADFLAVSTVVVLFPGLIKLLTSSRA